MSHPLYSIVLAKGKTKEVYCCGNVLVVLLILMFLMREGLQCRISILKHCLMRLCNDINQLTYVFPLPKLCQLSRCDVSWPRESFLSNTVPPCLLWASAVYNSIYRHCCITFDPDGVIFTFHMSKLSHCDILSCHDLIRLYQELVQSSGGTASH